MIPKILTRLNESIFEALIPAGEGYKRTTFPASSVVQVDEEAEKITLLHLFTGIVVPVALPYKTLTDYLYGDNMKTRLPFYDLTAVTGPALAPLYSPGERVAGEGIFVGQYTPKDRDGNSLSKTFNIFAAPEDLPGTMTYVEAVKRVKDLRNFHGHNGESYATDEELHTSLKDGSYKGGWIIPPRELLTGTKADGPKGRRRGGAVQPDNLYDHREKGAMKGTFCTKASIVSSGFPQCYWSCTQDRKKPTHAWGAAFLNGDEDSDHKDGIRLSCRLVHLVLVPVSSPG